MTLIGPSITFQNVHTFTSASLVLITIQRLLKILLAELESHSGPDNSYRRDTVTTANKGTFSRSSRSEKNLCHVLFSDGSAPKYNLYFPLTVGKILFFYEK